MAPSLLKALHLATFVLSVQTTNALEYGIINNTECSCDCESIYEGNLANYNEAISIFFELNTTTAVWISTEWSEFDYYVELFKADSDMLYQSIGCFDDPNAHHEDVQTKLEQGSYRIDIGSASGEDQGAFRVVVTLDTCFDGEKGGAFPAWVIGVIVFFCALPCVVLLATAVEHILRRILRYGEKTELLGRWIAIKWTGDAKPGGNLDPEKEEAVVVVTTRSCYQIGVSFPNRSMDEDVFDIPREINRAFLETETKRMTMGLYDDGLTLEWLSKGYDENNENKIKGTITYERDDREE